ncbi:TPA: Rha family transcriptional regulator [Streptococcus suis]|nr:Rha family transcriptional regulator [Streptococcus suis]
MELVYMDGRKEPYTLSSIVAECANISHHAVQEHIRKQKDRLERYGKVSFQMRPLPSGQQAKDYILNEQQATLLITFLRNTAPVIAFKSALVKAFFEMRDEVAEFRYQRALEKPKRKALHEAIETWQEAPKHAHSTVTNLLLKGASRLNKRQLMAHRGGHNGIDSLTSQELIRYQALEDMAIAMINLGMTYQDIKNMVFRPLKNAPQGA